MTTDPETERLREVVVESALIVSETVQDYTEGGSERHATACAKLQTACGELRAHLAKAAPLLPCPFCGGQPKLLSARLRDDGDCCIECTICEVNIMADSDAEGTAKWNTRHSPCIPDSRVMATDEAIREFWSRWGQSASDADVKFTHALLAHFTAPARVEPDLPTVREIWRKHFGARASHENADPARMAFANDILARFSSIQPTPAREVTDEEIVDLWQQRSFDPENHLVEFSRKLLALARTLTDNDLDTLWEIAKTTDRVVFPTEARARLNLPRRGHAR